MKRTLVWECDYASDRRKHRHRCQGCRRIVQPGERVLMHRISRGTRALHLACADEPANDGLTQRELFHLHANPET